VLTAWFRSHLVFKLEIQILYTKFIHKGVFNC
jgi:hypothetical protein